MTPNPALERAGRATPVACVATEWPPAAHYDVGQILRDTQ